MIVILLCYRIIAIISAILAFFVSYLIIYKSPAQMNNFKWHLLNIQCSTFVETIAFGILYAPVTLSYPITHQYVGGLLQMPVASNILAGFCVFLVGIIIGALCVAFTFRYRMLMPRSNIAFVQFNIENLHITSFIFGYGYALVLGFFGYKLYLDEDEAAKILHQVDPTYLVPKGVMFIATGPWVNTGISLAVIIWTCVSAVIIAMIIHSKRILKSSAQSSRSVKSHKQAFRSILTQTVVLIGNILVPGIVMAAFVIIRFFTHGDVESSSIIINNELVSFYLVTSNLKSIENSLVICYSIQPYRQYVTSFFVATKRKNTVSQTTVTVTRFSGKF